MKNLLWRQIFTARSPGKIIFSSSHFCYLRLISQSLRENILMAGTCGGPDGTFLVTPNVPYDQSFTEVCSSVMIPALGCLLKRGRTGDAQGPAENGFTWPGSGPWGLETLSFLGGSNDFTLERRSRNNSWTMWGGGSGVRGRRKDYPDTLKMTRKYQTRLGGLPKSLRKQAPLKLASDGSKYHPEISDFDWLGLLNFKSIQGKHIDPLMLQW